MISIERGRFSEWVWGVFLCLVLLAPASTKMAGTGWLMIVLLGGWYALRKPVVPLSDPDERLYRKAAKGWMVACLLAMGFKAVGMFYWDDPWWTRHFDFRLLLAGVSTYLVVQRVWSSEKQERRLIAVLMAASVVAFVVSYLHANYEVPTPSNRINWAGGLAMLACVLMSFAARPYLKRAWVRLLGAGVFIYMFAVLMSGARGAYMPLLWIAAVGLYLLIRRIDWTKSCRWFYRGLVLNLFAAVLLVACVPKLFDVPKERVMLGLDEAKAVLMEPGFSTEAVDTSIGTRIYMWRRSLDVIREHPWLGYGREQRITFIQEWGDEIHAHIVKDQTHLHNEYINGMVDHGVFGLASTLSYMIGLIWVAWTLRRRYAMTSLAVGGIAFIHVTMSLTDTNSQTNNYSVMLSLALFMIFMARSGSTRPGVKTGVADGAAASQDR